MDLKITDLKFSTVQANFEYTFVRVYSGESFGTGEAGPAPGLKGMEDYFKRLLSGEDAFELNRIEQKMRYAALYSGTSVYHAISAINIALYDLIGKRLNLPIYKLLGGDRTKIRVYADAHGGQGLEAIDPFALPVQLPWLKETKTETERQTTQTNPIVGRLVEERWNPDYTAESYVNRAKKLVSEGFTAIKFDLDVPTPFSKEYNTRSGDLSLRDIDYLVSIAGAVREAVGDEIDVMVDLHWRFNLNTAIRLCKALDPLRLRWIEDPVPAQMTISNLEEFKFVTSNCSTAIGTGENLYTVYQCLGLIPTGVRTWEPDLAKAGGVSEGRRIAELAAMYDIEFSPHNIGSPIATMAQSHVASIANSFGALEFHAREVPFWNDMVRSKRPLIEKGFIALTDEPGLGIELDENQMRKLWPDFQL